MDSPGIDVGASSPVASTEKSSLLAPSSDAEAAAATETDDDAPVAEPSVDSAAAGGDAGTTATLELAEAARSRLLLAVALNTLLVPTSITIIVPALRQISTELDASSAAASLTLSLYSIISGIQPLFTGPLSDRYGRRNALLLSHAIWAVSCVMCATAGSIEFLIFARCLQAIGCSSFVVVGVAAIGDIHASPDMKAKLPVAMAKVQMCAVLGVLGAPTLGGALTEAFGWRGIFWGLLILGGIIAALSYAWVPETLQTPKSQRPKVSVWMPFETLRQGLGDKNVGIVCLEMAVCHGEMFTNQLITPLTVAHFTNNELLVGMAMLPDAVGAILGSNLGGQLVPRYGEKSGMQLGGLLEAAGLLLVGWTMHGSCEDGSSMHWGDERAAATAVDGEVDDGSERELCSSVRTWLLVLALAFNMLIGLGLAANRVGATTYALKCRPNHRASVSGAQRFLQMMWVAVSVQLGAWLFATVGQGPLGTLAALIVLLMVGIGQYVAPLQKGAGGSGSSGTGKRLGGSKSRKYAMLGTDDDPSAPTLEVSRLQATDDDDEIGDDDSVYAAADVSETAGTAPVDLRAQTTNNNPPGLREVGSSAGYNGSSIAELETSTQEVLDKLMKEDLDDSSRSHGMPSEDITDFHEPSPTASAQATTQREQLKTEDLRI